MAAYKDVDAKTGEIRWRYRFAYNGQRFSGSTPRAHNTKKAAEKIEREMLERLIARQYLGKMPTVREFAPRFLEHQKARTKPLTYEQQSGVVENHIVPIIGPTRLDHVDKEQIDRLVTAWSSSLAPKTINTRLGTVRRMLSLAVEWGYIARIPRFAFLKISNSTPRFLSDAECQALIDAALPQWRPMIVVALRTGLRIGELRGLQWDDVDFRRRVIQVRRTDPGRKTMDATSPKGNRERTVPLTNDAIDALASIKPAKPRATDWVWPALLKRSGETRSRARSEKGCWHGIDLARIAAKLENVDGWHTLRHTYASHLVMRGVPIRVVQQWLGHASIKETEKYSHLAPEHGYEAANLLDVPLANPETNYQHRTKQLGKGERERKNIAALPSKG